MWIVYWCNIVIITDFELKHSLDIQLFVQYFHEEAIIFILLRWIGNWECLINIWQKEVMHQG